jgi:cell division protein FtsB
VANGKCQARNEALGAHVAHLQRDTNYLKNIANAVLNILIVPAKTGSSALRRVILFLFP